MIITEYVPPRAPLFVLVENSMQPPLWEYVENAFAHTQLVNVAATEDTPAPSAPI